MIGVLSRLLSSIGLIALSGIGLVTLTEVSYAEEAKNYSTVPRILDAVNTSNYHLLSNESMAEVVGAVIPNGIYQIAGVNPNGIPYNGTANIAIYRQPDNLYTLEYVRSDDPQSRTGYGFEHANAFTVISTSGAQNTFNFTTYILNPDGSLSGRRWIGPDFASGTETLVPTPGTAAPPTSR